MISTAREPSRQLTSWQRKLLPFLVRFVTGLAVFFLFASLAQLYYLHREITDAPPFAFSSEAQRIELNGTETPEQRLAIARFRTAAELDLQLIARRYRQASVLLLARVWAMYLGFVTGMMLCLVGAAFVLAKLREPGTEVTAQGVGATYSIKSASPGIILAALGVALMLTTIVTDHRISVKDTPTYLEPDWPISNSVGKQDTKLPVLVPPADSKPKQ